MPLWLAGGVPPPWVAQKQALPRSQLPALPGAGAGAAPPPAATSPPRHPRCLCGRGDLRVEGSIIICSSGRQASVLSFCRRVLPLSGCSAPRSAGVLRQLHRAFVQDVSPLFPADVEDCCPPPTMMRSSDGVVMVNEEGPTFPARLEQRLRIISTLCCAGCECGENSLCCVVQLLCATLTGWRCADANLPHPQMISHQRFVMLRPRTFETRAYRGSQKSSTASLRLPGMVGGGDVRGEGAARPAGDRYGSCDICGERNDPALEALVEIECNQRGCKHSPATYHQSCILDVIERNPIGVREKRRYAKALERKVCCTAPAEAPSFARRAQDVLSAAPAPLRCRWCADSHGVHFPLQLPPDFSPAAAQGRADGSVSIACSQASSVRLAGTRPQTPATAGKLGAKKWIFVLLACRGMSA